MSDARHGSVRQPRVERRLAAILVADAAGYSRLMGADEVATLRALKGHRNELVDPLIAAHHGRIVKNMGDGFLVEFASAVDAVACGVATQHAMARRNADVHADRRIAFRIGINVGDIIVEGTDIHGDGVNVAARMEALAEPGGICISGTAYEQVRDKLPFAFVDQGEQTVKNIAHPVHVYALGADAVAALTELPGAATAAPWSASGGRAARRVWPAAAAVAAAIVVAAGIWIAVAPERGPRRSAAPSRFSMVVLPFANLSGDPAQDYLADVITEELTTSLSRIPQSFVIARSTAFTYKGKAVDTKRIGRDLGVRYVLEGSEQQAGNRVRVNAQLIDAETGAHLWADQFDADRADLLAMQDEIVTRLSRALQLQLVEVDAARIARTHPGNPDAEDLAMRCEAALEGFRPGSAEYEAGFGDCEHALQLDAHNVRALVGYSYKFIDRALQLQSTDRESDVRRADELVSTALATDPNAYAAHFAKAEVLIAEKRFDEAIVEAERSLALNPSFVSAYGGLGLISIFLGRPERAVEYADKAMRLSPRDPLLYVFEFEKGFALALLHQDDQAIALLRQTVSTAPQWPLPQAFLAAMLAITGHEAEARETLKRYLALSGTRARTIAQWRAQLPSDNPAFLAYAARFADGLRKAGMPEE